MAIWSANPGADKFNARLHEICFKTNLDYDNALLPYDIVGLKAHGRMLAQCGLIPNDDGAKIDGELAHMLEEARAGQLKMSPEWEDCHSLIESTLIERIGDAGKRLYMARSRNDQVVSATRLYTLDRLAGVEELYLALCQELLEFARRHATVPMPGYTHTQRAMPATAGMWAAAYLEILLAQAPILRNARSLSSVNALGSAAGYGTAFPIDRDAVTRELGVERTLVVSLAAQISRGQVEAQTLHALWGIMLVINRISTDLVWLTSAEFDFFDVAKSCTTGSSIMPNKKNLDPCEILRARYHVFCGYQRQVEGAISSLLYGYNSDYQETKGPFLEGMRLCAESIEAIGIVLAHTTPKEAKMRAALSPDIFATDLTNRYVMQGATFRDAYIQVKKALESVEAEDPATNIRSKTHLGAPGNIGVEVLAKRLDEAKKLLKG